MVRLSIYTHNECVHMHTHTHTHTHTRNNAQLHPCTHLVHAHTDIQGTHKHSPIHTHTQHTRTYTHTHTQHTHTYTHTHTHTHTHTCTCHTTYEYIIMWCHHIPGGTRPDPHRREGPTYADSATEDIHLQQGTQCKQQCERGTLLMGTLLRGIPVDGYLLRGHPEAQETNNQLCLFVFICFCVFAQQAEYCV